MDRLTEIEERFQQSNDGVLDIRDTSWLIAQVKWSWKAAQSDQIVIQRLRQELDQWAAIAEDATQTAIEASNEMKEWQRMYEGLQAKLARANHLAVSLTERVMR